MYELFLDIPVHVYADREVVSAGNFTLTFHTQYGHDILLLYDTCNMAEVGVCVGWGRGEVGGPSYPGGSAKRVDAVFPPSPSDIICSAPLSY